MCTVGILVAQRIKYGTQVRQTQCGAHLKTLQCWNTVVVVCSRSLAVLESVIVSHKVHANASAPITAMHIVHMLVTDLHVHASQDCSENQQRSQMRCQPSEQF
jgi:hypothetical protein